MQQEAGTSKKGKRPVQEDELIPSPVKVNNTLLHQISLAHFRQYLICAPSSSFLFFCFCFLFFFFFCQDNVEMPVSGEAESSNKKMTGSDVGENEYSNNGSPGESHPDSHGESHPDQIDMPEVSIFDGKDFVLEQFKVAVMNVWDKLRGMLEETPVEHISSLQESFNRAFASLHKLDLDISPLETRVNDIFEKARKFDELRSSISEKMSSESQGVSLSTAKDELKNAQDKVTRLKEDILNQHKSFKAAQDREAELERELKLARPTRENWDTLIAKTTEDLGDAKTAVSEAKAEVTRIQELSVLTSEDAKKLKKAKGDLEVNKNDMLNFRLFVD
nr:pleckstrin homology domain-containing family D member 1-like [Ipomoea batatas]